MPMMRPDQAQLKFLEQSVAVNGSMAATRTLCMPQVPRAQLERSIRPDWFRFPAKGEPSPWFLQTKASDQALWKWPMVAAGVTPGKSHTCHQSATGQCGALQPKRGEKECSVLARQSGLPEPLQNCRAVIVHPGHQCSTATTATGHGQFGPFGAREPGVFVWNRRSKSFRTAIQGQNPEARSVRSLWSHSTSATMIPFTSASVLEAQKTLPIGATTRP